MYKTMRTPKIVVAVSIFLFDSTHLEFFRILFSQFDGLKMLSICNMERKFIEISAISLVVLCLLAKFSGAEEEPFSSHWRRSFLLDRLPESRPLQIPPPDLAKHSEAETETSFSPWQSRKSKLFPYFLVQFPNDPCSNAAKTQHGICVSAKDCRTGGGSGIGICAQGFGTCCKYVKSCGTDGGDMQIRENSTEIRAGNGSSTCRFILPKTRGICQVRLDMLKFEFGNELSNGECSRTKVEITGDTVGFPNLCGNLTGQHLYLHYGNADRIYVHSGESTSTKDEYSIRISYIRCDSRQLVPLHCSQHLTGTSGKIQSFNWPHQQLNSQEYTICIADPQNSYHTSYSRKGKKFRRQSSQKIEWTTCGTTHSNKGNAGFFISGRLDSPQRSLDPEHCDTTDYVQVFGGNKQCGNLFRNETIASAPFLVHVRFDEKETNYLSTTLSQGQGHNEVVVGKPEPGCTSLNTDETMCEETQSKNFCKCRRSMKRPNSKMDATEFEDDEGNTGFCLAYKITE